MTTQEKNVIQIEITEDELESIKSFFATKGKIKSEDKRIEAMTMRSFNEVILNFLSDKILLSVEKLVNNS